MPMMGIDNLVESGGDVQPFIDFMRKYREDPELRARAETEPGKVLAEHGIPLPPQWDVRIVEDTAETSHFVMPPDPNKYLADEDLAAVAGGNGCSKTAFCFISCISSFS